MNASDDPPVNPSEQRGGSTPGEAEAQQKGEWAGHAGDGVVPRELGGSDAPPAMLGDDPELGSAVLGQTTGSEDPATESGVDRTGGARADAVTDGGAPPAPAGAEPDLKDAAAGPRQSDLQSAQAEE